jgi:hypothetical protein
MAILHKECLATELAVPANQTVIAAVFDDGTGTPHVAGAQIYTKAETDTALALKAGLFSVQEEGAVVQAAPTAINFVGAGITATTVGTVATVTVDAATTVPVQEEGTVVTAAPSAINFVGPGVTASDVAGVATVTIPKITSFVFDAAGDGSALITFSDATTIVVAAIPAPAAC